MSNGWVKYCENGETGVVKTIKGVKFEIITRDDNEPESVTDCYAHSDDGHFKGHKFDSKELAIAACEKRGANG